MLIQVVKYKTINIICVFSLPPPFVCFLYKAFQFIERCMESKEVILMEADSYVLEEFYICHNLSSYWSLLKLIFYTKESWFGFLISMGVFGFGYWKEKYWYW